MSDLRRYRLYKPAFGLPLAALLVLAFSLEGVPPPIEPPAGTIEFDEQSAADATRAVLAAGEQREPGSAGNAAAADLVRERFEAIASGAVAEQRLDATVAGDDVELRNVLLTLPDADERAILVLAGRDSRGGPGAPGSAAATGMLLALASTLAVSERNHTLIFASTDAAHAGAEGARELIDALPDRTVVEAAIVIHQPGFDQPSEPHLLTSSGNGHSPSIGLVTTAQELLRTRSAAEAGLDGALGQVARLALPAVAGQQATLIDQGLDAVAISSAGEAPLGADEGGDDRLDVGTLARFGPAVLALVSALDAAPASPQQGPRSYVRIGGNLMPGWALSLLALALLAPPAALVAPMLSKARRDGELRQALRWGAGWCAPALAPLAAIYALALIGLLPGAGVPYDPGRYEVGPMEVVALMLLAGTVAGAWWLLRSSRGARGRDGHGVAEAATPQAAAAAAAAIGIGACAIAWLANPFLALVLVSLTHAISLQAASGRKPAAALALPAAAPLLGTLLFVAATLDWGAGAPWQLVVLVAGGGLGPISTAATLVAVAATVAVSGVVSGFAAADPAGREPEDRTMGTPGAA